MAPTRMPIGTLKQRVGFFISISLVLLLTLRKSANYSTSPSSPNIITKPLHQISSSLDLSSPVAPFITYPLARVCAETIFVPGLVFICDNNSGGPGNIRNYILTCLRYAIEAGSTSLILPRIRSRSPTDLSNIHLGYQDFGYMFNAPHFRRSLAAACPQMLVWDAIGDVPHVLEKVDREGLYDVEKMIERITPRQEFGRRAGCDERDLNRHTDRFGQRFRDWLNTSAVERGFREVSVVNPRLIRLNWGVLWDWEVLRDGPEFVTTFGGLLRFRDDLLELGHAVTKAARRETCAISMEKGGHNERFLGVHLRTEDDALKEWPSFEVQAKRYMIEAEERDFRGGMAYLASGSQAEVNKFKEFAQANMQLHVRTKFDLLEAPDHERLVSLSWDQQAVVDFIVLLAVDYFLGVSPSSFSINVALKRHLQIGGLYARPRRVDDTGDERSLLVGKYERYWDDWLFMYDGMWP